MRELYLRTEVGYAFRIDIERTIGDSKRLSRLQELLVELHHQRGRKEPEALAGQYIEKLLVAAYSDVQKAFEGKKGAAIDRLLALQGEAMSIYTDVLKGRVPDLERLRSVIREMEGHFSDLRQSLEESMRGAPRPETEKAAAALRDVPVAEPSKLALRVEPAERLRSLAGDSNWKLDKSGTRAVRDMPNGGKVTLDASTGEMVMTIEEPGKTKKEYKEFQMLELPYRDKPPVGDVMQAHHGCMAAMMEDLLPGVYDRQDVVTIWLRDSTTGSPHGIVTNQLQPVARAKAKGGRLTYGLIRDLAVEQLNFLNAPASEITKYLKAHDAQVMDMIKGLTQQQQKKILGNIKAYY